MNPGPTHTRETDRQDLKAILEASGVVGTWDWNIVDQVVRSERGAATLLAGDPDAAGRDLPMLAATATVHPADGDWLDHEVRRVLREGGLFAAEYRVLTRDSGVRWLLSRGRIVLDDDGQAVRGRGLLIDITESRGLGNRHVARATSSADDPFDEATDHCIQAQRCLQVDGTPFLRMLVNTVLLELGHELARRLKQRVSH